MRQKNIFPVLLAATLLLLTNTALAQQPSHFQRTEERFQNGEIVWALHHDGQRVGEFWPVQALLLVNRELHPGAFSQTLPEIVTRLQGVAIAPDGMTVGGSSYQLQGRSLARGYPCGTDETPNFGIIVVDSTGYTIRFTHRMEHPGEQIEQLYRETQNNLGTLFFLPSIYRKGNYLSSLNKIDKVLFRREVPAGEQIGVIIFDQPTTYDEARIIITGLDRSNSTTTHIYVLDGGPSWGQSCRRTNGQAHTIGTRNAAVVTNYLIFY